MNERTALITLALCVEPGDDRMRALVEEAGPVQAVEALRSGLGGSRAQGLRQRLAACDPGREQAAAEAFGARIVDRTHPDWPQRLDDLGPQRPYALWVRGRPGPLADVTDRSLAVVGARSSTPYGAAVCRTWCAAFVDAGYAIVSGGAIGIDAAAHQGALAAGGATVCVLATGVDVPYPRENAALIERIARDGHVVSESPLGSEARRQRFLSRNRIVSALGCATVVVEAALRSGTTSTASAAARLSRPVLAVPGPVTSPMSAGCHRLIAEGQAMLARSASDVLGMAGPIGEHLPEDIPSRDLDQLTGLQMQVLDSVPARGAIGMQQLMLRSGLGIGDVAAALAVIQEAGFVVPVDGGWSLPGRA